METIEDVRKLSVSKGDVIVVRVKHAISHDAHERIKETVSRRFPDNEIIVLDNGMSIDVFTPKNGE